MTVSQCMVGCMLYERFSKRNGQQYWKIVSFIDDHTCHRTAHNRNANTKWLAKK